MKRPATSAKNKPPRIYRRGVKLSNFDKVTKRNRLDFHSLRRSAITALKHAGIPEHEIAEVVGHEHPRVTFGVSRPPAAYAPSGGG